jgi:Cu(I)/Ag(I) efflux system membrane protein CusA/SilA
MIATIIRHVIRFRWLVWCVTGALVVLSAYALRRAPLDAIPDISDPQIIVYSKWPRSPLVIETEVTEPIIRALAGSPDIQSIRGTSHMGYSFVYVILRSAGSRNIVRQYVSDRLNTLRSQLPQDANVVIGPNASSVGWIFQYALVDREGTRDLRELRLLNESAVKPALQSAAGVAEVASVGGLEKQYQVRLLPPLMSERGIALNQVIRAFQGAFQEAGGRTIEVTNREYQLRGSVDTADLDKLEYLVLGRDRAGDPVHLRDVGYLQVGYDLRRGIADLDGVGEVVGGIAIMEQGRNVLAVTNALEDKLTQLRPALPKGIEVVTTYNRSSLIWETLTNFFQAIGYELLVVIVVIAVALKNLRAAVAPVCVLLLGTLFTSLPLSGFDQTINLFALAGLAIAIGEMADATIVIVENCTAELAKRGSVSASERMETIIRATATMTRPLLFSMLIIVTSFLPIFFLGAREGRLFNPLAFSKTFAMAFSTLLTLFLLPAIIAWVFKRHIPPADGPRESRFVAGYRCALVATIRHRYAFVGISAALLVGAAIVMASFQKDYMPEMEEGSILYMPTTLPGLPSKEAGWILQQMDKKLKAFPEVERVFGKLGRADTATDPAPVEMIETTVTLKPRSQWRAGMTKDKLIAEMNQAMQIVGYVNSWTQPINTRVMMQDTGIQTPVGIKIKGSDLAIVGDVAQNVEALLKEFPGTQSVIAERIARGYFVDARLDLQRMASHGVTVEEAMPTIQFAIGGDNVIGIRQADKTVVPLAVQYSPEYVDTLAKVKNTPVITADGRSVPLADVADVAVREAPEMIRNDNGNLAGYIYVYLDGITASEYVERAREYLRTRLTLPPGYSMEWTGLYQYTEDARSTLRVVVPITLAIMFILLVLAFHSVADSSLIMLSAPFALVGGVLLQWALGYSMTTAVIIGYVSLFAVAIQTGIIMIEFIREALARRPAAQSYMAAVIEGSVARLRPKLMTVATTVLGLLPIMFATGSGMDITKPIATPTFGGMITSTIYVLFLIPCLFAIGEDMRRRWPERFGASVPGRVGGES